MNSEKVNQDLVNERATCTFDREEFTEWWYGNAENVKLKRKIDQTFFDDPTFKEEIPSRYLSLSELHRVNVAKNQLVVPKVHQLVDEYGGPNLDIKEKIKLGAHITNYLSGSEVFREGYPFVVHIGMFSIGLLGLATQEQQDEWLEKVYKFKMIGTYAQTELGHGTFVRGIQTTATYDIEREEFIMNTPCLEAYKWWPGGLAFNSNYAIVVAQLYTKGEYQGVHQFLVQIRDSDTWAPMPGVKVGECGPKVGIQNYNNGFLCLNNVRIPRKNMLMRFAQVLKDGTHVRSKSSVLAYNTMMHIRSMILFDSKALFSMALTIATRYTAVRRQGFIEPDQPEHQIMDYVTQQYKIIPQIAMIIVYKMLADFVWTFFGEVMDELNNGDLSRLPEIHFIQSCYKPLVTSTCCKGIEQLRLSCGGHGYLDSANFLTIYAATTASCTYEGENTVLYLQAARYLIKSWGKMLAGEKLDLSVSYLKTYSTNLKWDSSISTVIKALQTVAANKTKIAYERINTHKKSGLSHESATNLSGIELVQAAESHAVAQLVQIANETLQKLSPEMSPALREVIQQLVDLYVVDLCLQNIADILRFTIITEKDIDQLEQMRFNLLSDLRCNAVGIVDAFDLHDKTLSSTLGSYDGNVYERLYKEALKSPMNKEGENERIFELYMKPLINSKL